MTETAQQQRYHVLATLAWDLRLLERATTIVSPRHGEPVLYLPLPGGRKLPIVAIEHDGIWHFLWGRNHRTQATPEAASRILATVTP